MLKSPGHGCASCKPIRKERTGKNVERHRGGGKGGREKTSRKRLKEFKIPLGQADWGRRRDSKTTTGGKGDASVAGRLGGKAFPIKRVTPLLNRCSTFRGKGVK